MGLWNPKENVKALFGNFTPDENEKDSGDLIVPGSQDLTDQKFLDEIGLDIARRIAPSSITFQEDYMKSGDFYMRTLYISEYPSQVPVGWLQTLYQYQEALDISLFVQPIRSESILRQLRKKVARETAQIHDDLDRGAPRDFEREKRLEDSLALQEALEREETKPFQVSLVIQVKAQSKDQLDIITDAIERRMDGIQAKTRRAARRQKDGLLSIMPVCHNYLKDAYSIRNMQTHAVQTMFPLTSSDISHESGVLYGVNMSTHSNVILDRFRLDNPNMIVLGHSGAGKSFMCKMELLRWQMHGVSAVVIDPQNEYQRLCEALGGQFISISVNSKYKINPLDFSHAVTPGNNVLTEKILNMMKLIGSMLSVGTEFKRGLDAEQGAIVDQTLLELYGRYGYTSDPATQVGATPQNMPLLSDLHDLLAEKVEQNPTNYTYKDKIGSLVSVLSRYIRTGSLAGLFDEPTNVDLRNSLIVFNVQGLDEQLRGIGMHGILEFVRTTLLTPEQLASGDKKLIYIDEAHRLMKFPESAAFIEDLAKTTRKFNVGLTVLTQDPEDFLKNQGGGIRPEGVAIVRNCAMQVLLRQHKSGVPVIAEVFGLTENEADYLLQTEKGEGLLFAQEDHAWISMRNMASPMEYELITTNPEEVAIIAARQRALQASSGDGHSDDGGKLEIPANVFTPLESSNPSHRTMAPMVEIERRREASVARAPSDETETTPEPNLAPVGTAPVSTDEFSLPAEEVTAPIPAAPPKERPSERPRETAPAFAAPSTKVTYNDPGSFDELPVDF